LPSPVLLLLLLLLLLLIIIIIITTTKDLQTVANICQTPGKPSDGLRRHCGYAGQRTNIRREPEQHHALPRMQRSTLITFRVARIQAEGWRYPDKRKGRRGNTRETWADNKGIQEGRGVRKLNLKEREVGGDRNYDRKGHGWENKRENRKKDTKKVKRRRKDVIFSVFFHK
jgi:hypothetical protein